MTYHVKWIQTALDDMATLWINADSAMRDDMNRAANFLDQQLGKDPFAISESRDPGEWVCFSEPLGFLLENRCRPKHCLGLGGVAVSLMET